jgi:hypothetical protein
LDCWRVDFAQFSHRLLAGFVLLFRRLPNDDFAHCFDESLPKKISCKFKFLDFPITPPATIWIHASAERTTRRTAQFERGLAGPPAIATRLQLISARCPI